jgi:signal transduction histidine kinase
MSTTILIFLLALTALSLYLTYLIGFRQGEENKQGDLDSRTIESYAGLLESMARLAASAQNEDPRYLESLTRILQAHTQTVRTECIIDFKQGEVGFIHPNNQQIDWAYHALVKLQEQNPFWAEDDERLARALFSRNASPMLMAFQDDVVTRVIVQFYPSREAQEKAAQGLFFKNLIQVVSDIRARSLSSAYYERAARQLQENNTRMKRLFSNVRHNLGNALSGVMTGLGTINVLANRDVVDPDQVLNMLRDTVLPNYQVSNQMVAQMYESISVILSGQLEYAVENYQLRALFDRYFGSWLIEQGRRLTADVEISWDIPEEHYIKTSDLVFFQVVWNVLKNAIKYTQEGSIRVSTFQGVDDRIYLRVKDTGAGISDENLQKIGNYGFRGEQAGTGEGEGIGLWGAYQLVEAVDGHIYFNSRLGSGTECNIGFLVGCA